MTKEQAQEYATRIRLGEPLYWSLRDASVVFADTVAVMTYGHHPWTGADRPTPWRPPVYQVQEPSWAQLGHGMRRDVLAALDELAK
jgi:hypothetical protein